MANEYVVEYNEKCPECNGKILITEDYSEAQCEDCLEEWTLKDEDEITETDLKEGYVDIGEEEKSEEADYDFDEDEDDDVIDADFIEIVDPSAQSTGPQRTVEEHLNLDELAAKVLAKSLAMAVSVISTPQEPVLAEPTNPFLDGTRENQLMETLLTGPQKLEDIKKALPKTRGKPPTAKTIKSWVMALDNLRDWKVIEEDDKFSIERRRDE